MEFGPDYFRGVAHYGLGMGINAVDFHPAYLDPDVDFFEITGPSGGYTEVVTDVSLSLQRGEILGLVGESGCGKSTTARALLGLAPLSSGSVFVHGEELRPGGSELPSTVQAIFQNPTASFNPRLYHAKAESYFPMR